MVSLGRAPWSTGPEGSSGDAGRDSGFGSGRVHHPLIAMRFPRAYGETVVTKCQDSGETTKSIKQLKVGATYVPVGHQKREPPHPGSQSFVRCQM